MKNIHPTGFSNIPVPVRLGEDGRSILLLDQTLLPIEEKYLQLETVDAVAEAIRSLRVRGAPAIGIAAAFGLAIGTSRRWGGAGKEEMDLAALEAGFRSDAHVLGSTRPTAVNLAWALDRMASVWDVAGGRDQEQVVEMLREEALAIAREDREMCRLIGHHGLDVIPPTGGGILTHCNAGALATGGMGTALAPVYSAQARGIPVRLFADETRPLLQGGRLTAWEATRAGLDVTVITDSMSGALMAKGEVNLVIVGADRIAANGDVANKIGTYGVAVAARHHGLPFYVAAPWSTFDLGSTEGSQIPIEERDPEEVGRISGTEIVPTAVPVWNPAFDITPAHLVTAFITDGGILRPPYARAISDLVAAGRDAVGSPTRSRQEEP
jgi:methylthioribose-1-phosphate isomerase